MSQYNIIAESSEYTVVSEFEHSVSTSDAYQSEADLEREFIHLLGEQGYDYLPIHTEADLISNLRTQLEKLNSYHFTDTEWEQFFNTCIANKNDDIVAKTSNKTCCISKVKMLIICHICSCYSASISNITN